MKEGYSMPFPPLLSSHPSERRTLSFALAFWCQVPFSAVSHPYARHTHRGAQSQDKKVRLVHGWVNVMHSRTSPENVEADLRNLDPESLNTSSLRGVEQVINEASR